jgi:hypothetical protein
MGRAGRERVRRHFLKEDALRRIEKLLVQVAAKGDAATLGKVACVASVASRP